MYLVDFLLTIITRFRKELYGTLVRMIGYDKKLTYYINKAIRNDISKIPAKTDFG